jgi:hypothetical protein
MTSAANFFKQSDSAFGVFYPTNYLLAAFPSYPEAESARQILLKSGYVESETLAIRGDELIDLSKEAHADAGFWSRLTAHVSRLLGTEELYLDNDLKHAKAGAGFLAVYCPGEEEGRRIQKLLDPLGPVSMRRYSSFAIERMM